MWLQPELTTLAKKQGDLTPPLENMRVKWRHDRETSNSFIDTCFLKNVLFRSIILKQITYEVCLC